MSRPLLHLGHYVRIPAREGWASVVVLDRAQAAQMRAFAFPALVTRRAAAATI